jgi:MoaE-MoaD fusion protein
MSESTQTEQIKIRVLFFGAARDVVGSKPLDISLNSPATVASAFENLSNSFPELQRFGRSLLFAVNQEYATRDKRLQTDDELAVFPPVSGGAEGETGREEEGQTGPSAMQTSVCESEGSDLDFFELTTVAIDVGAVARRVVLRKCGATVTLDGYAREWTAGKRTCYLVYESYAPMALAEMERLGCEAHERFAIAHIGIVHRTGRLEIGETSVVIAVSAPHRGAAFAACEWAIRELKRTVPIWKKEVFEDGEVWVEGEGPTSDVNKRTQRAET